MSLIISATDQGRTTLCSEDRAGVTDTAGNFIPVDDGHIKSIRLTPEIVFGVLGPVSIANRFKATMSALGCLGFERLTEIIPTLARALMEGVDASADLNLILTGCDGKKIRTVVWNTRHDDFQASEEVAEGDTVFWVLGTCKEAHDMAGSLLTSPDAMVPECIPDVFGKLADTFAQVGRGLTVHTVTRPVIESQDSVEDSALNTVPYHASAFRNKSTTIQGGSQVTLAGATRAFTTVGSFPLQIPSNATGYKGTLTVTQSGGSTTYVLQGRLKIGSQTSNIITLSDPATTGSGTVTVTGLTGGTSLTVEVQAASDNSSGTFSVTNAVAFQQVQYTDQDANNLL